MMQCVSLELIFEPASSASANRLSVRSANESTLSCAQIISYESPRGGVTVTTAKGDTTTSVLLIRKARPADSGQYKCNPSNAQSQQVNVLVLNGRCCPKKGDFYRFLRRILSFYYCKQKKLGILSSIFYLFAGELPAAMQHGGQGHHQTSHLAPLMVGALAALLWHGRSS